MKKIVLLFISSLLIGWNLTAQITIIPYQDSWKYIDNGVNQGTAWRDPAFNDASWKSGNGKFGFGIPDATTTILFGPDSKKKYITTYFRKTINLSNPSAYTFYPAEIRRDDGVIVYVNGTEVYRNNMNRIAVTYDTLASGGGDGGVAGFPFNINSSAFVPGNNVIAVEVHQDKITSSDLAFDFKLTTPDLTPPSIVSINRLTPLSLTTSTATVIYRVTFSEPVNGVGKSDFTLFKTGTANGSINTIHDGDVDGAVYDLTITSVTGAGTMRLDLKPSATGITDKVGNAIPNGDYTLGQLYNIDRILPLTVSINRESPPTNSITSSPSLVYRVTFSEKVLNVDPTDFTLSTVTGTAAGVLATDAVSPVGTPGTQYDITASSITGAGTLRLDVRRGTNIQDTAGNLDTLAFITGQTYTVDRIAPVVTSIHRQNPTASNISATSVTFRIIFSKEVSGVDASDFSLTTSGTVSAVVPGNAVTMIGTDKTTYDVIVNSIAGSGSLRLDLNNINTGITDVPGNPVSSGFASGDAYIIDHTSPVVLSIDRQFPLAENTTGNSVTFRIIFSEQVTGVDLTDFTLSTSGTASGTLNAVSAIGTEGTTYDITVSGLSGTGTIHINLNQNNTSIADLLNNLISGGFTAGQNYSIAPSDQTPPVIVSILRYSPVFETTSASSVTYRIIFSEAVTGLDITDFNFTALSGNVTGELESNAVVTIDPTTYDVTITGLSGTGTLRLDVNTSGTGIADLIGNLFSGGFTGGESYNIEDNTIPTVISIQGQNPSNTLITTNALSLIFRITFSEKVTGVDVSDFSLSNSGTAGGNIFSVSPVGTDGSIYDITVGSVAGSGTIRVDLNETGTDITDLGGHVVTSAFTTGQTYMIDRVVPTTVNIVRQSPLSSTTYSTVLIYRVTFSEQVSGVDASDFVVSTTGSAIGTLPSNAVVAAGGNAYDVTVNAVSGNGTIRLDLLSGSTNIQDASGNLMIDGFTTGAFYTIDQAPVASSINRQVPASVLSSQATVTFRITFSEAVTGVDISDFSILSTGTANGTPGSVTQVGTEGTSYDITVGAITGAGTLRLNLNGSGTGIVDAASNEISGGFITGEDYTIDRIVPAVISINRQNPAGTSTSAPSVTFRIIFTEPVNGVDVSDFALITGTASGNIFSVTPVGTGGGTYDVVINSVAGAGTIRLDLNASGTNITDLAGNLIETGFTNGQTYTIDRELPVVVSIVRQSPASAITLPTILTFRITFSEQVTGVDVSDFILSTTGTATGTLPVNAVVTAGANAYDVTVNSVTGYGTVRLDLKSGGTGILDASGNMLTDGFSTGDFYTIDQAPFTVGITRQVPTSVVTSAAMVTFRITFSEAVTGVDISDFSLVNTGTASGTPGTVTSVGTSGNIFDVTVSSITGGGTMRLNLNTGGTGITDANSNPIAGGFATGETYTIDRIAPTVISINRQSPSGASTSAASVTFRIIFAEPVSGVDIADFTLVTGTASGTLSNITPVGTDGSTYDVAAGSLSGTGTIRLDVKSVGTGIIDAAGNAVSGGFVSGQSYIIDRIVPVVVSIIRESPSTSVTSSTVLTYRVTFSEHVFNVNATDFNLFTTGSTIGTLLPAAVAEVSSNGTIYDVTVTSVNGAGTIRLDLVSTGTGITDTLGNNINGGFTTGETYSIDQAPYVISINRESPTVEITSVTSVVFKVTFSEAVTGVDPTDFLLATGGPVSGNLLSNAVVAVGTQGNTYNVTVSSISGTGTIHLDLKVSGTGIIDAVGNSINGGFSAGQSYTIDQSPLVVSINRQLPLTTNTTAWSVTFRITFSKKVTGVDAKDFVVTAVNGNARGSLADVALEPVGTSATGSVVSVGTGGNIYDVSVRALAGTGTLRLDLKSSGTGIADVDGNAIISGYTTGQTYSIQQVGGFSTFSDVGPVSITTTTGERPMSKVWTYAGKWWSVLATSAGTRIFRLDGTSWTASLILSSNKDVKADVITVGAVSHILLYRAGSDSYLASVEYDPATTAYKFWTQRPALANLGVFGSESESSNLALDGNGRMWVAWDESTDFRVKWSDFPYSSFSSPIIIGSGATTDDICAIVSMPGKIGLLWSDQSAKRFFFRTHTNGAAPSTWSALPYESPASQSAKNIGAGFSDDHLNIVCATDGTLYCAVKTSYDKAGEVLVGLLVRRPAGTWDNIYAVTANEGTRAQVILNEVTGKMKVVYASQTGALGGEDIMYRESSMSNIVFGQPYTLIGGDLAKAYNYVTTTHQLCTTEMLFIASETSVSPKNARTVVATEATGGTGMAFPSYGLAEKAADKNLTYAGKDVMISATPNPFANQSVVRFILPKSGQYTIRLYNAIGKELSVIKQGRAEAGKQVEVFVEGAHLINGIYFVKIETATHTKTIKLAHQQ